MVKPYTNLKIPANCLTKTDHLRYNGYLQLQANLLAMFILIKWATLIVGSVKLSPIEGMPQNNC